MMKLEDLREHYGTNRRISIGLGMAPSGVAYWSKRGYIPYPAQLIIQEKTNGLFKACIEHARPGYRL